MSGQQFVAETEYVVRLVYDYTGEATTDLYVYVNDILEIYLEDVTIQSANGKFGIGASVNTSLKVGYSAPTSPIRNHHDAAAHGRRTLPRLGIRRGRQYRRQQHSGRQQHRRLRLLQAGDGWLRTQVSLGGEFGPANGWSSARTNYDMGIPTNHIFQYEVNATTADGTGSAVAHASVPCDLLRLPVRDECQYRRRRRLCLQAGFCLGEQRRIPFRT
ncbi:MAG: hypothetical protein MZU97_10585 [Bacillus subtilis]|nr:hypothetical protein [Bacillus subtilis]